MPHREREGMKTEVFQEIEEGVVDRTEEILAMEEGVLRIGMDINVSHVVLNTTLQLNVQRILL